MLKSQIDNVGFFYMYQTKVYCINLLKDKQNHSGISYLFQINERVMLWAL